MRMEVEGMKKDLIRVVVLLFSVIHRSQNRLFQLRGACEADEVERRTVN